MIRDRWFPGSMIIVSHYIKPVQKWLHFCKFKISNFVISSRSCHCQKVLLTGLGLQLIQLFPELLNEFDIILAVFGSIYVPRLTSTDWVLPVNVNAIELVLLYKGNGTLSKLLPRLISKGDIRKPLRQGPATHTNQSLDMRMLGFQDLQGMIGPSEGRLPSIVAKRFFYCCPRIKDSYFTF